MRPIMGKMNIAALAIALAIALAAQARAESACTDCHADAAAMPPAKVVGPESFAGTSHKRLECVQCHTDYEGKEDGHEKRKAAAVNCATCHEASAKAFRKGVHGVAAGRGDRDAPTCRNCHGTHHILPASDPDSSTHPANMEPTCFKCHSDPGVISRHRLPDQNWIKDYESTVHWGSRKKVSGVAYCTSCHGAHAIVPAADPESSVNRWNVARTCGQCHEAVFSEFRQSVHGKAYLEKNKDVPVCTDCHGAHTIKGKDSPESFSYPTRIATMCLRCHDKERIVVDPKSIPVLRGETYFASYHGIGNQKGDVSVANCASCHGSHNIRKSSDPQSTVNAANIPRTCGKCHPGAGVNFALGKIHVDGPTRTSLVAEVIGYVYTVLIAVLMSTLVGLVLLDLYGRFRRRRRQRTESGPAG
jgi:5-methylcytosine-specific restriction endonuclease McrA